MRYVLTAQDYQFINGSEGQAVKALALSVPKSVWESLDTIVANFESEVREEISSYQEMLLESFDSLAEIGKTQKALFYAAAEDLRIQTKEEYNKAVQEAYAVYEGIWDTAVEFFKMLTEGGSAIGILHLILDIIGMLPASWFGFPVDVVANVLNGIIYGIRGMWFLSILSLIAAIPANYVFKGLKVAMTPFTKILDKLGIAIFKADSAAIKLASAELKTAAGVEKASMLSAALSGFVQFCKNTLLGIVKGLGGILETVLNKVTFGLVPKGKIVSFIQNNVEVPLTKAVKGSEEAVNVLKQGDEALFTSTKDEVGKTIQKLTKAEQDEILAKFNKLGTGDGDLVMKIQKSDVYKQMIDAGAPKAAIEAYIDAAAARYSFNKAFNKVDGLFDDPKAMQIMKKAGWVDKSAFKNAIKTGDAETVGKVLKEMTENPAIIKSLSESEAAVLRVYSQFPADFIKHGKNFDGYLTTLSRLAGKFSYREKIGKKLFIFVTKQLAKAIMNSDCYQEFMDDVKGVRSTEDLGRVAATQLIKEAEAFSKNSEQYKRVRAEIVRQYQLEETPETEPEIHKLTIEALQKAKSDCGTSADTVEALGGGSMNPGLYGDDNKYGEKFIDDQDFKKVEDVISTNLELAGLDPNISPVKDLSNSDPMVKLYFADFYEPGKNELYINDQETNLRKLGERMVKSGEVDMSEIDAKIKEIENHWKNNTEPVEVQKFYGADTSGVNESAQINNQVKLLKFESFKNSLRTK